MKTDAAALIFYEPYTIWYNPFWKSWWFILLSSVVAVVLVAVLVFWLIKRFKTTKKPWQLATAQLQALAINERDPKIFYTALTTIIKDYVLVRFAADARGVTDTEFVELVKSLKEFPQHLHQELDTIYSGILSIKFAQGFAQKVAMENAKRAALKIIVGTIPKK